jgi:hypothetical protein
MLLAAKLPSEKLAIKLQGTSNAITKKIKNLSRMHDFQIVNWY